MWRVRRFGKGRHVESEKIRKIIIIIIIMVIFKCYFSGELIALT